MGQTVKLTASDGFELTGYRADPSGTPKGGLVLIQEIFGINGHIRSCVDYFASQGYATLAPALFDRVGPGIELGYGPDDMPKGREAREKLNWDTTIADVDAARKALEGTGKIGIIGYCFGGAVTWQAAAKLDFVAAESLYGGGIANMLDLEPKCPMEMHFGEEDRAIPMDQVEQIKAANKANVANIYTYPGAGHGFCCDERDSFHPAACEQARGRALAFFGQHLA